MARSVAGDLGLIALNELILFQDSEEESSSEGSVFEGDSEEADEDVGSDSEDGSDCEFDHWAGLTEKYILSAIVVDEDDDSDGSASFDDESGEDWDELERKAKRGKRHCSPM